MREDVSRLIAGEIKKRVQRHLNDMYKALSRNPESIDKLRVVMDRISLVTADESSPERLLIMDFTQLWTAIHQRNALMAEELWKYLVDCDFYQAKSYYWIMSEFKGFYETAQRNGMTDLQDLIQKVLPRKLQEYRMLVHSGRVGLAFPVSPQPESAHPLHI